MTRSRTGNFKYVPQNEFVATKNKYFDDIRDGKIDLTSSDLYSRVKTRRRCYNDTSGQNDDDSPNRPSSLTEMTETVGVLRNVPTRYSEPSTPKTFAQSSSAPMNNPASVVSDSTLSHTHQTNEESSNIPTRSSFPLSSSQQHIKRHRVPSKCNFSFPSESIEFVSAPKKFLRENEDIGEYPEPITLSDDRDLLQQGDRGVIPIQPRPTVTSSLMLMPLYLDLTIRCSSRPELIKDILKDFPIVQPLDDRVVLRSQRDILFAINNQHWSLLASQPIENIAIDHTGSTNIGLRHPLVAAIIRGEGRPFLVRRLLQAGSDPNYIDHTSTWPILLIAVYYRRIEAVRVLFELGAQPNASVVVDGKQQTALGIAIATGNVDMVSLLVLSGANPYRVHGDMNSVQFIVKLLSTSKISFEEMVQPPPGFGIDAETARRQFEASANMSSIPLLDPAKGWTLPRSPYDFVSPSSSSTKPDPASLLISFDGQSPRLPSSESLHCIHKLIASYHTRLLSAVDCEVKRWLLKSGMIAISSLLPNQWIYLHGDSFTLDFPTPLEISTLPEASVLALFLIHGTVTPPGCYHLWLDCDGPCFVNRVLLGDIEQRPLAQQYFVCTLIPIDRQKEVQSICVYFSGTEKGTCIIPLILRLKSAETKRLKSASNSVKHATEMPRLRSLPSTSSLRQKLH